MASGLRAERFEAVDAKGRIRAELRASKFVLYDDAGKERIVLEASSDASGDVDQAMITVKDKAGKHALALTVGQGVSLITFARPGGQNRMMVGTLTNGSPYITLYSKDGKVPLANFSVDTDEFPSLTCKDGAGRPRLMLGVLPKGGPMMGMLDKNRRVLWRAPK